MRKIVLSAMVMTSVASAKGPGDVGSVGSDINQNTIQGQYLIQAHDVGIAARISLKDGVAMMEYNDINGRIKCMGAYQYDSQSMVIITDFPKCGGTQISHAISLAGTNISSLQSSAEVKISIKSGDEAIPNIPFTITKQK